MKSEHDEQSVDALAAQRHSLAHLTAAAVLALYPQAHNAIGPAVDNGFYQDFALPQGVSISEKDFPKIEKKMREFLKTWTTFTETELTLHQAQATFAHNPYKLEMMQDIYDRGEKILKQVSGDFVDLCRGGHTPDMSTIDPESFMLDRVAGAYWKNDEKNTMLTRIYGLAFATKEELDAYLAKREEAKQRDHRKIGIELDLFTFSDLVGPGLPLFTPKGTLLRDLIIDKIQNIQKKMGYQKVCVPHITKKELYMTSGHWDKFGDELFKVKGQSDTEFVMKPMNCPHHTQIYASKMRSYKDLPLRFMELGVVYRDEQAGELLGLSRVRAISQDDGHIFCRPDQIEEEIKNIVSVIKQFYTSLNMLNEGDYWVSVSVRDPQTPEKYLGDPANWDRAEAALESIAMSEGLPYKRVEGEAAFYGPKLDFQFKDAMGREWQLGTAQLDFVMPARFGLEYTDAQNERVAPVMIHRAIAGSLERFLSVIIEHFAGAFPVWLSPVQVAILPVSTEKHGTYAEEILHSLREAGVRVEYHDVAESLSKRIRTAKLQKVPYLIVIGDKELEQRTLTVEGRNDVKLEDMNITDFLQHLDNDITHHS